MSRSPLQTAVAYAFFAITLFTLLLYSYAYFFVIPWLGFHLDMVNGQVMKVYAQVDHEGSLQLGDKINKIGKHEWEKLINDKSLPIFAGYKAGDVVSIQVERNGELFILNWKLPEPTRGEIEDRVNNVWWVSYVFCYLAR